MKKCWAVPPTAEVAKSEKLLAEVSSLGPGFGLQAPGPVDFRLKPTTPRAWTQV